MRGLLITVVLLVVAALAIFEIGRLIVEFSQEEPEFQAWEPLVALLAWATAVAVLIGVSKARDTIHRVGLAFIVPMGVLLAAMLMISGFGVILLTFADFTWECVGAGEDLHCESDEVISGVKEMYAVVLALLISGAILGGATWLARRGSSASAEDS